MTQPFCIYGRIVAADGSAPPPAPVSCTCNYVSESALGAAGEQGGFSVCLAGGVRNFYRSTACTCTASAPGFRRKEFAMKPELGAAGTIVLERLAGPEEGPVVNAKSFAALPGARKAYKQGMAESRKRNWKSARGQFERAVKLHPGYAAVWYELGVVHGWREEREQARHAFERAIASDARYTSPYLALANFHLGDFAAAERSARAALELDTRRRLPAAEHILGLALAEKGDWAGATLHFRHYLNLAPQAPDAGEVRARLEEAEKRLAAPR